MKERYRTATVEFPWVDEPTYMGKVVGFVYPGEIHNVSSCDRGETWFLPYGPILKKEWIDISGVVIEFEKPKKLNWLFRWLCS